MKTPTVTAKIPADAWATLVKLVPQYAAYAVPYKRRGFKRSPLIPGTAARLEQAIPSPFLVQTTSEMLTAYADCTAANADTQDAYRSRQLEYKAAHPVTVAEARAIFAKACPGGYNAFTAKCLRHIPADRMVYVGRAFSPVVYVLGPEFPQKDALLADEFNFYPDGYTKSYGENQFTILGPVTRVWFD